MIMRCWTEVQDDVHAGCQCPEKTPGVPGKDESYLRDSKNIRIAQHVR